MSPQDFIVLKKSIKENGQQEPITVNSKGIVLDGHNRLRACKELEVKPKYKQRKFANEDQEKWFIIQVNLNRRHLTDFQRCKIALLVKPLLENIAKERMSKAGKSKVSQNWEPFHTDKKLAELAKVSTGTFHKAQKILASNIDRSKLQKGLEGRLSIHKLYSEVKKEETKKKFMETPRKIDLPNSVRLFNEDFKLLADKIPDASVDLIFTDPPYSNESIPIYKDLGIFANRVLKDGGSLVSYIGQMWLPEIIQNFQSAGLNYWWMFAIKMNGQSARMRARHAFQQWKPLLWFVKGEKLLITTNYLWDFIEDTKQPEKALHEWEQSRTPPEFIIPRLTYEGGIVCDPMMGSGTTGVAALNFKRQFMGIEIDKARFEIGQARISDFHNEIANREAADLSPFEAFCAGFIRALREKENKTYSEQEVRGFVADAITATAKDIKYFSEA